MIEQRAQVVAIENGQLLLRALARVDCPRCAAGQGCGGQLFGRRDVASDALRVSVRPEVLVRVGDQVILGIDPALLQRSALLLYTLPLLVVIAAAATLAWLNVSEIWQVLLAVIAMLLCFGWIRRRTSGLTANAAVRVLAVATPATCVAAESLPQQ